MSPNTLVDWVDFYAKQTPHAVALSDGQDEISYAELRHLSCRFAVRVLAATSTQRPLICIYQDRALSNVVAMIGIVRAGGSYTVLETGIHADYASKRLREIGPDLIVSDQALLPGLTGIGVPSITCDGLSEQAGDDAAPAYTNDIAYVLFTSGSTGTPKGVMVRHSSIAHYASTLFRYLGIVRCLHYAHVSSLAADLGNTSIFLALYSGGALFLVPDSYRKDPSAFFGFIDAHCINFLKMTPSHWLALSGANSGVKRSEPRLDYLLLGGEVLSVSTAAQIMASGVTENLVNHYGPTETTVGVIAHKVREQDLMGEHSSIPIGLPFGETQVLVIGGEEAALESAHGELYIGGPSVSAGYLNDPEQTAARFVHIEQRAGTFYRTGDKVFRDASGFLFCQGRIDRQVKIGGYRVELDHVEAELAALPQIAACAVESVQSGTNVFLVAAIVLSPQAKQCDARSISQALTIPEYMRPRFYRFYSRLPLNQNGKADRKRIQHDLRLQFEQQVDTAPDAAPAHDTPMDDIRRAWAKYLRFSTYTEHDSLFAVGGDSITAIQIISELQVNGYAITIQGFLDTPTMHGLYRKITAPANATGPLHDLDAIQVRRLSAAQESFFRHGFEDGNHWSQAFLLECLTRIDPRKLEQVVTLLTQVHPMLRTGYQRNGQEIRTVQRTIAAGDASCCSHHVAEELNDAAYQAMIFAQSARLQQKVDIERGDVFQVCLICSPGRNDHLLLIAHHLAIDAVSWRIVIDDIVRCYDALVRGEQPHSPVREDAFWHWTQHLHDAADILRADRAFWPPATADALPRAATTPAFEHQAQSCWSYFSEDECAAIANTIIRPLATSMDAVILAAFAQACQQVFPDAPQDIDVESYGRAILHDSVDVTRTVGWFTSTFPLAAADWRAPFSELLGCVTERVKHVPHLGVAYGLSDEAARPAPRISYNYLGQFNLTGGEHLQFAHARHHPGAVRGSNQRQYDLTLTVKLQAGALILDCNFSSHIPAATISTLLDAMRTIVLFQAGMEAVHVPCLIEPGTTSGLLAYVPPSLVPVTAVQRKKEFSAVLLTGATGFIGSHLLERLLAQMDGDIFCIVRADNDDRASERLLDALRWSFPQAGWTQLPARVNVLAGDIAQECFGLSQAAYAELCRQIDAVYHFAADTRLLGGKHEFFKNNVDGLDNVIRFAKQCGDAEIHYMSTLAVAGVNKQAQAKVFSETELDIGQDFNNNYEVSKFESEKRLNEYRALGGKVCIYRSGNVTADSRNARFQRNAQDNRFIQTIMALVRNGEYSSSSEDAIILSPVDLVADGVVSISLSAEHAAGVYHVESNDPVSYNDIYRTLRDMGLLRRAVSFSTLDKILLAKHDVQDKVIALGRFWAQRPERNVIYNNAKTTSLLARHGIRFPKLDQGWWYAFFDNLDCVKGAASTGPGMRSAAAMGVEHDPVDNTNSLNSL
jgi:amino acid adenylation domain-containing protein/thioester reductase-like protein